METAKPYVDAAKQRIGPWTYEQWGRANGTLKEFITIFEGRAWAPLKMKSNKLASEHPFLATLFTVFSALAFWPIVLYLGFVAFVLITSLCMATAFVFGTVILFATTTGIALLFTLFITLLISFSISFSLIGVFLFLRFVLHVRSQPTLGDGVQGWAQETKERLLSSVQISKGASHGINGHEKVTTL